MDENIAKFINFIVKKFDKETIAEHCLIYAPNGEQQMLFVRKGQFTQTAIKKAKAITIEIPDISGIKDKAQASALIALAVGRRLERYERGAKANAGRDVESRRKIAQNAIQTRWNAK